MFIWSLLFIAILCEWSFVIFCFFIDYSKADGDHVVALVQFVIPIWNILGFPKHWLVIFLQARNWISCRPWSIRFCRLQQLEISSRTTFRSWRMLRRISNCTCGLFRDGNGTSKHTGFNYALFSCSESLDYIQQSLLNCNQISCHFIENLNCCIMWDFFNVKLFFSSMKKKMEEKPRNHRRNPMLRTKKQVSCASGENFVSPWSRGIGAC